MSKLSFKESTLVDDMLESAKFSNTEYCKDIIEHIGVPMEEIMSFGTRFSPIYNLYFKKVIDEIDEIKIVTTRRYDNKSRCFVKLTTLKIQNDLEDFRVDDNELFCTYKGINIVLLASTYGLDENLYVSV